MSTPEGDLTRKCMGWLKGQPSCWSFKVYGNPIQAGGIPDVVMCINGHFVAAEMKRPDGKGKASTRQLAVIERIKQSGGLAEVVDSFEGFKKLVMKAME